MSCVELTPAQKKKNIYKNTKSGRSKAMEFSHIMRNTKFDLTRKNVNCDTNTISEIEYIYVIGGEYTPNTATKTVKKYNNTIWTNSNDIITARLFHGSAIYNGMIYIIGGFENNRLKSIEYYDGNQWSNPNIDMNVERSSLSVAVYENNLYAIGGFDNTFNFKITETFNGIQWTQLNPLNEERISANAVVYNNLLYIIGGRKGNGTVLKSMETFNTLSSSWSISVDEMTINRYDHMAVVYKGSIYVIGGRTTGNTPLTLVEKYNTSTGWISTPPIVYARYGCCALVYNNLLYVIGGKTDTTYVNEVEVFNGFSWSTISYGIQFPAYASCVTYSQ
jgi:N-acetylneuraminic acid mutarotase